jgi:TolB-like protein
LLQHPAELITREQIRETLWSSNTFVDFDRSLNKAMVKLRQALDDNADAPQYIETLPRRGYRFLLPVEFVTGGANGISNSDGSAESTAIGRNGDVSDSEFRGHRETVKPAVPRDEEWFGRMRTWIARAAAVAACVGVIFWLSPRVREGVTLRIFQPRIRSLVVLPLENLSGDPAQDYFADGMTEELTTELSQVAALKVISRTSAMRYKKTDKLLPQIARELSVDAVVEGTVLRSGNRVRITAQLIRANTDEHIWARSYEQDVDDVLSLQESIAREVTKEIRVNVTPQEKLRMARPRPVNLAAIDAYLQGEYHFQKAKNIGNHRHTNKEHEAELKAAVDFYHNCIVANPDYAPAYIRLAEIWGVALTFPFPSQLTEAPAREAVRKAMAIDPGLAEAYLTLARIEFRDWNWSAAEREVKRAIELNPNLASAHRFYSDYLNSRGRLDDSMEQAEWAKSLDPNDDAVAWVYYVRRNFGKFIELKKSDIARQAFGSMAHYDLGYGYERAGQYKDAVDEWAIAMHGWGYDEEAEALRQGYASGDFQSAVRAWVTRVEGRSKDGEIILPALPAYLYAISGDKDRAFAWLEKDLELHTNNPPQLNVDPTWDDLRSDPRYAVLLRRIGLIR